MTLLVRASGPMLTVQDRGRPGRADEGIARAGAFDVPAAALANRLVGNDVSEAVFESLLGSCTFDVAGDAIVAVTGATLVLRLNDAEISMNAAVHVVAGDVLRLGMPTEGSRAYLAMRGGLDVPLILGSRSYDSLGKIGPPPIAAGDRIRSRSSEHAKAEAWFEPIPVRPRNDLPTIHIVRGPRYDWLNAQSHVNLVQETWTVEPASDRTGVRLRGVPLTRSAPYVELELPSEAMIVGAIQVPPNGQPIILGPDCGTTGGYPVVGVVRERSMPDVAQLRPGQQLRLRVR